MGLGTVLALDSLCFDAVPVRHSDQLGVGGVERNLIGASFTLAHHPVTKMNGKKLKSVNLTKRRNLRQDVILKEIFLKFHIEALL